MPGSSLQLQQQRVLILAASATGHGHLPIDGAALADERKQVIVFFFAVVVHVCGADAVLHDAEVVLYAFADMGVPGIEGELEVEVGQVQEHHQAFGR